MDWWPPHPLVVLFAGLAALPISVRLIAAADDWFGRVAKRRGWL